MNRPASHTAAGADGTSPPLDPWLAAARTDLASRLPPLGLEGQVQARLAEAAAWRALRTARPAASSARATGGWRWVAWLALPVAAACALLLATALALQAPPAAVTPASGSAPSGTPFIALASMDTIAAEPDKVVVPAELPRAALTYYGLPFDPARADQPARAELLMSARGAVLAVRFVQ